MKETKKDFDTNSYELPQGEQVVVDATSDKIIDLENMNPFDKIKGSAGEQGIEISDPIKNCKKCYGRGYVSLETKTKMPNPCTCIFTTEQVAQLNSYPFAKGRKLRRKEEKHFRAMVTRARLGGSPTKKKVVSKRKKK